MVRQNVTWVVAGRIWTMLCVCDWKALGVEGRDGG